MKNVFLQAICQEPEEETHRLVFADWLDENGDEARAEFIRLQCDLAKREIGDPEAEPLLQREAELLDTHGDSWRAELPTLPGVTWSLHFRRGFVETAQVRSYNTWKSQAAAILQAIPLRILSVYQIKPSGARRLARSPGVQRVRGLEFPGGSFEDSDLEIIARSCQLHEFHYAPSYQENVTLGPDARHILASMPGFAGLKRLDLDHVSFGNSGIARLTGAANMAQLTTLRLRRCEITSLGASLLAGQSGWGSLRRLDLSGNMVGDEGCRALASSPALSELRELDLSANAITTAGVIALARSMFLRQLHTLKLNYTAAGDDGIVAIATSPNLRSLRCFEHYSHDGTAANLITLLRSPLGQSLHSLSLGNPWLSETEIEDLLRISGLDNLKNLRIGGPCDARLVKRFGSRIQFATPQEFR